MNGNGGPLDFGNIQTAIDRPMNAHKLYMS